MKTPTLLINKKKYFFFTLFLFIFSTTFYSQEQNSNGYRTLKAYIDDFAKNELYVKKSIIEYSNTIIENQLESRSMSTSKKIIDKLKNINSIIKQNDKGFNKNTLLRDSFIKMNEKTIECLSNGTLIMNDYVSLSQLSVSEINITLSKREVALKSYFEELREFEKSKKEFGRMNNIKIKSLTGENVLEYNAYQNVLFFKINVLDEKINASIININDNDFNESIKALDNAYLDVISKTTLYKSTFVDTSLNSENLTYSNFIHSQKKKIIPLFNDFSTAFISLQKLKKTTNNTSKEFIETYNTAVKTYNLKKNILFDTLEVIQENKKNMYNKWLAVNRTFLKNNVKFTDIYEGYTVND